MFPNYHKNILPKKSFLQRLFFQSRGFTLIEVMVSVSIFTIVVTIGIGSLITMVNTQKRLHMVRTTMDSLSFSLESMSRRIRTGTDIVVNNSGSINFVDQNGKRINYFIDNNRLVLVDDIGQSFLTPINVRIDQFVIRDVGLGKNDAKKSFIRIHLVGTITVRDKQTRFALETIITPREIDQ